MFKTAYNYKQDKAFMEQNNEPSMTVPDLSITVNELFMKYRSGIPVTASEIGEYDENSDIEDFDVTRVEGFDLLEATTMLEDIAARKQELSELEVAAKARAEKLEAEGAETKPPSEDGRNET